MRFSGKTVLVIGGNSGIGLASAQRLAEEGGRVVIAGRDPATLASAKAAVGHGAEAVRVDVADMASLDHLVSETRRHFGRLDVLVISAGIGGFVPVRQITEADWDQLHGINIKGVFFAAQKALALMQRGGSIVLIGSIGAVKGIAGNIMYATAKAGVRALGRNLAAELVDEGIRVNVVSPGPVETPLIRRNIGLPPEAEHELRKTMIEHVPMHRMGEPHEVAAAVAFLAASEASFITGIDLFVDGGVVSF